MRAILVASVVLGACAPSTLGVPNDFRPRNTERFASMTLSALYPSAASEGYYELIAERSCADTGCSDRITVRWFQDPCCTLCYDRCDHRHELLRSTTVVVLHESRSLVSGVLPRDFSRGPWPKPPVFELYLTAPRNAVLCIWPRPDFSYAIETRRSESCEERGPPDRWLR